MCYIRHTNAITKFYENLDELIDSKCLNNKKIIIFGTNKVSSMITYYLEQKNYKVYAFIDNNVGKQNRIIYGHKVYAPSTLLSKFDENVVVLLASSAQNAMINQLEQMGYIYGKHIFKVVDLPEILNDYSFVDRKNRIEMNENDIKEIQIGILNYLKEKCKENNLCYFLASGTLIGAVRHKGFIPWDDDVDVYMKIDDIEKLAEILKNDKRYRLISMFNENDYIDECSLLVDINTCQDINHFPMQLTTGLSIDIFPLHGVPEDKEELLEYIETLKTLEMNCYNNLFDIDKCSVSIKELIKGLKKYKFDESTYIANFLSLNFMKTMMKKEDFLPAKELEFEGELYSVPFNYDKWLTQIFGEYMTLPPVNQRIPHHYFKAYKK